MSTWIKLAVAGLLVVFLLFSVSVRQDGQLDRIELKMKKRGDNKQIVDKDDVKHILRAELGHKISHSAFRDLDLYALEKALESDNRISRAEMFINKNNVLTIGILQNLPIARVEVTGGDDYYLDLQGNFVPIKGDLIRVPVITGNVDRYIAEYKKDEEHNLNYLHTVSRKVYEDDFLTALVSQIHITDDDDIVLIPIVGRERIALGSKEELDEKIYKLKTYYKEGLRKIGVDRFKELDLRYEGQIIGKEKES